MAAQCRKNGYAVTNVTNGFTDNVLAEMMTNGYYYQKRKLNGFV